MKIKLTAPGSPYKTSIDTEHFVTIDNPGIGPILTNGDFCVAIFARDGGFEGNAWRGEPTHDGILPDNAFSFTIDDSGLKIRQE